MLLTLPFPPSVNHLYATVRGRRVLTKRGRDYHDAVWHAALEQCGTWETLSVPVRLTMRVWVPNNIRRDISNLIKVVEDGLTHAKIFTDDRLVHDIQITRAGLLRPHGYIEVVVEPIHSR